MRISLLWQRVVVSRITILYFIFSLLHCIVQSTFQIRAFVVNNEAVVLLRSIIYQDKNALPGFTYVDRNSLRFCGSIPQTADASSCRILWSSQFPLGEPRDYQSALEALGGSKGSFTATVPVAMPRSDKFIKLVDKRANPSETPEEKSIDNALKLITDPNQKPVFIHGNCLKALNWPAEKLANTKREDLAFIGFQFWLFGMSLVAILNESIPHILASLGTHVFATAWGIFQLAHTANFRDEFDRVITNGACAPTDLLANYWKYRSASEIPSLVLNGVALLISMFLTWKLIKQFGWQTYKFLGSNMKVKKMYACVLYFSIILQLGLFFMVVGIALWIDQIGGGAVAELSRQHDFFRIIFIFILSLMVPWLFLGWYSVRKESRVGMWVFVIMTFGYVGGFALMFAADTFRWTIITWPFFGLIEAIAATLAITIMVLSILCRINFGKGLAQALTAHQELVDKDGFTEDPSPINPFDDPEKYGDLASSRESLPQINTQALSGLPPSQESADAEVYMPYRGQATVTRSDTQKSMKRWVIE